ncbi:MAG: YggT family protein [Firmicutes bacterium]|nr:YggT family protein [Bacillota bacterium]
MTINDYLYLLLYYSFYVLRIYFYIMIVTIILSWTPIANSKFYLILQKICAPYLNIFRGWIVVGNMDFTPMLGLILYQILLSIISRAIF